MVKLANTETAAQKKATRAAYGATLAELATEGVPVVAVDADLTGSTTTKKLADAGYAGRLFNCGIAEQNMIDVAAGLSLAGNIAFTGSFAVFGTGRAYDQIRNTVCYSNLNVKIAPTHAGISVGPDGGSHQMLEDVSLMRGLPGMRVLVPADYFAINAPADKFAALGMSVVDLPTLEKEVAESLMHRPGGSVSLAVGMAHIFGQIPWMAHLMSYWYHFAIMFEAVFILTAVDAGTRVGRFFLQEMIGKVIPKFGDKNWWPGIVVTSFLFTGAWGYLVYTGDISSIWPLFGISNQLLASVTLLIGTTMLLRMNKTKYAWITAAPGIFMTFITFWAGIWLIMYQYIPTQKYLLASLSVLVMVMMGFVIIGTLRRWSVLLKETKIVRDPYGDEVKEIVQE